jgi:hypothetical protein
MLRVNPSDAILLPRALEWLNEAIDEVQTHFPEAEFLQTSNISITMVASQSTYPLPTDFLQLLQLRNDDESVILTPLSREEFDRRHPDPSDESDDTPTDITLEYDRSNGRHILRVAPAPDAADTWYGIMRRWHPALSGTQGVQYDPLQRVLERWGAYFGSLEVYADAEHERFRGELFQNATRKLQGLGQVFAMQKPKQPQVPTVLRKSDY